MFTHFFRKFKLTIFPKTFTYQHSLRPTRLIRFFFHKKTICFSVYNVSIYFFHFLLKFVQLNFVTIIKFVFDQNVKFKMKDSYRKLEGKNIFITILKLFVSISQSSPYPVLFSSISIHFRWLITEIVPFQTLNLTWRSHTTVKSSYKENF